MNSQKTEVQTAADYENELQSWILLWQTSVAAGIYSEMSFSLHKYIDLTDKYPAAKIFALKMRNEILKTIKTERFLKGLRGDNDSVLWRKWGQDAVHTLIQTGIVVKIFEDLNWAIGEPGATMAYYQEVATTPGVADVLDRLFWDYWLRTERWDKVLDYAKRHGWLSIPLPDEKREEFTRRADGLFLASLRSKDIPNMLKLLDLLNSLSDGSDKKAALKSICRFYRADVPAAVQQRIDQFYPVPKK
jgi:hypothetical protein